MVLKLHFQLSDSSYWLSQLDSYNLLVVAPRQYDTGCEYVVHNRI